MTGVRNSGYCFRDLSFDLSLMVLGIKYYIESTEQTPGEPTIYGAYEWQFLNRFNALIINLAVNFRVMDDQIKSDPTKLEILRKRFLDKDVAFSILDQQRLGLRHAANKIIHAKRSHWRDEAAPYYKEFNVHLNLENAHDLIILEGDANGKDWVVGVNMMTISEQFYEFSEVACEWLGL